MEITNDGENPLILNSNNNNINNNNIYNNNLNCFSRTRKLLSSKNDGRGLKNNRLFSNNKWNKN